MGSARCARGTAGAARNGGVPWGPWLPVLLVAACLVAFAPVSVHARLHSWTSVGVAPGLPPAKARFLAAICLGGRLSNQIICLKDYLRLAKVLNRTLLVPTFGVSHRGAVLAYTLRWAHIVDWPYMRACFHETSPGRDGVIPLLTFEEYFERFRTRKVVVGAFVCAETTVQRKHLACTGRHKVHVSRTFLKLHHTTLVLPPLDGVKPDASMSPDMSRAQFEANMQQYDSHDIITFGHLEYFTDWMAKNIVPLFLKPVANAAGSNQEATSAVSCKIEVSSLVVPSNATPNPHSPCCPVPWQPPAPIRQLVLSIRKTFFVRGYAAVHLRRDDIYRYLMKRIARGERRAKDSLYPSIAARAKEVARQVEGLNQSSIFLATDARKLEIELFKAILLDSGSVKAVLTLADVIQTPEFVRENPSFENVLSVERDRGIVLSVIDKFMCVGATSFYGSELSTFTGSITMLRKGFA